MIKIIDGINAMLAGRYLRVVIGNEVGFQKNRLFLVDLPDIIARKCSQAED